MKTLDVSNKNKQLKVNRVGSNKSFFKVKEQNNGKNAHCVSKISCVRHALTKYRITPYLVALKKKMIYEIFSDPTVSVEQACGILARFQREIQELEYFHNKAKKLFDVLTFTQKEILSEIELGESTAQVAKNFNISSRTAVSLVEKVFDEICD